MLWMFLVTSDADVRQDGKTVVIFRGGARDRATDAGNGPAPATPTNMPADEVRDGDAVPDQGQHMRQQNPEPQKDALYVEKIQETNGVALVVKVRRNAVAGGSMPLEVVLVNRSREDIIYGHLDGYHDYKIEVVDGEGRPVAMTQLGKTIIGKSYIASELEEHTAYSTRKVKPGRLHRFGISLSAFYDLSLPGKYMLLITQRVNPDSPQSFRLQCGVDFTVSSPTVEFRDDPSRDATVQPIGSK
jgi:hypothetical protein